MSRLGILLFYTLDRDKTHTRPAHGLTDCLSVNDVVLVALDVRLDELGCNQLDLIAPLLKLTGPVMS